MRRNRAKKAVKIVVFVILVLLVLTAVVCIGLEFRKTKYNIFAADEGTTKVASSDGDKQLIFYEFSSIPSGGVDVFYRRKGCIIEHYLGTIHYNRDASNSVKNENFEVAWDENQVMILIHAGRPGEQIEDSRTWLVKKYKLPH